MTLGEGVGGYRAWFECFRGCSGRWPLTKIIYRCPQCEGLLTVQHDMERLKQKSPAAWKMLFRKRAHTTD